MVMNLHFSQHSYGMNIIILELYGTLSTHSFRRIFVERRKIEYIW